jgi:hypothetical protein
MNPVRILLAALYADVIIGVTFFSLAGYLLLMLALLSVGLVQESAFYLIPGILMVMLTIPYVKFCVKLVREAWKLPKEMWGSR